MHASVPEESPELQTIAYRLAAETYCDPRTALRELRHPGIIRGRVGGRLRAAIAKLAKKVSSR